MAIRVEEEKRCKLCGKQRNHDVKEVHTTESNSLRKNRSRRKKKLQTKLENKFEIL